MKKPSERINEIHKELADADPIGELRNIDGASCSAIKAIITYLDEQWEAEHKSDSCQHQWAFDVCQKCGINYKIGL